MMRRTQNRWSQLKVGLVLLIALGGLLVAVMNLDEGVGIFTPRAMLRAHLDDSQGLKVGAPVRMNGVDVGNVKRIAIEGGQGKVAVHFTVNRDSVGFHDNQGHFRVEPGRIDLYAGDSSTATLTTTFTVTH